MHLSIDPGGGGDILKAGSNITETQPPWTLPIWSANTHSAA